MSKILLINSTQIFLIIYLRKDNIKLWFRVKNDDFRSHTSCKTDFKDNNGSNCWLEYFIINVWYEVLDK